MSTLTDEQRHRMEQNRLEALKKRAAKHSSEQVINKSEDSNDSGKRFKTSTNDSKVTYFNSFSEKNSEGFLKRHSSALKGKSLNQSTFYSKKEPVTGHCKLIKKDRFSVDIGYHEGLIKLFKSIPSSLYDPPSRTWNFSLNDHGKFLSAVSVLKDEVSISPLPSVILETFSKPSAEKDHSLLDLSRLDPVLLNALMPFQKDGVCFGISKNGRCLIADEMGLGKTIQALGIAHYYCQDWPLLIVCPSSVKYTWKEAIATWLPSVSTEEDIIVISNSKEDLSLGKIVIMSFEIFSRSNDKLLRFRTIIVDESHFLKNSKTARSQVAFNILRQAKRVILLSGTPALSRPAELFPQLTCIDKFGFPRMRDFGIRYCDGKSKPWGWDYSGASNMEELLLLLEKRVMIRRLKVDVMAQLPEKTREVVILDPSSVSKSSAEMNRQLKNFNSKQLVHSERRGALLSYFNATGAAKLKAICDYVEDLLEDNQKFLCFAHHRPVLDGICQTLNENGIRYIRIDGSTPSGVRKSLCDEYQYSEKCRVAVLSITAANAGITLSASPLVIFAELFWNPGILAQAEDRAHRIGQKNNVVVRYLVAQGTADDYLWSMLQGKLEVLNSIGLSKDCLKNAECGHQKDPLQKEISNYFEEMSEDFDIPP